LWVARREILEICYHADAGTLEYLPALRDSGRHQSRQGRQNVAHRGNGGQAESHTISPGGATHARGIVPALRGFLHCRRVSPPLPQCATIWRPFGTSDKPCDLRDPCDFFLVFSPDFQLNFSRLPRPEELKRALTRLPRRWQADSTEQTLWKSRGEIKGPKEFYAWSIRRWWMA
jgi:hypothetical protein